MNCNICGKKSEKRKCEQCSYLMDHGGTQDSLRRMYSDDRKKKIWQANEQYAIEIANTYYRHVINDYPASNDSKENFGYNTFVDGIRSALDIVLPLLSNEDQTRAIEQIHEMVRIRKGHDGRR